MFNNIGHKIKVIAYVFTILGIAASVIAGLIMILTGERYALFGILTMIFGSLAAWIGSFLIYGFGELIDKTTDIDSKLANRKPRPTEKEDDEKKLKRLRDQGYLTEEEYQAALSGK